MPSGGRTRNADPSSDPLIYAIELGHDLDAGVLELAITFRLAELDRLQREIGTLERKRAEMIGAEPRTARLAG